MRRFGALLVTALALVAACGGDEPQVDDRWVDLGGAIYVQRNASAGPLAVVDPVTGNLEMVGLQSVEWYGIAAPLDGAWLLATRDGVARLDARTGEVIDVVSPDKEAANIYPGVSPSGQRLSWRRGDDSGWSVLVRPDTGGPATRVFGPLWGETLSRPRWLNENELGWLTNYLPGGGEIFAIDVATLTSRRVGADAGLLVEDFAVNPATGELVVALGDPENTEFWIADTAGVLHRRVLQLEDQLWASPYTVSPDGEFLAIPVLQGLVQQGLGSFDLLLVHLQSGARRVIELPEGDETFPVWVTSVPN